MEPLRKAAAAIALTDMFEEIGPRAVGTGLQELRRTLNDCISSLPPQDRNAAKEKIAGLANEFAFRIVAGALFGVDRERGGNDDCCDGPGPDNQGNDNDSTPDTELAERRRLAFEAVAAKPLSIFKRVHALLGGATRRQCDKCSTDAVVCDSNNWCLMCPLCDKGAQLANSSGPSFTRYVLSEFNGVQVP